MADSFFKSDVMKDFHELMETFRGMGPDEELGAVLGQRSAELFQAIENIDRSNPPSEEEDEVSDEDHFFLSAVQSRDVERVKHMLERGTDPNCCDAKGRTALHLCCVRGGFPELVRILAGAGADMTARMGPYQETPLHLAAQSCSAATVAAFLEHGGNPYLLDIMGCMPLARAQQRAKGMGGASPSWMGANPLEAVDRQEVLRLMEAAASEEKPLEQSRRRDGCGRCGATETKLSACGRCCLKFYCGRDCQRRDWAQHKQRCSQAKDLRDAIELIADVGKPPQPRHDASMKLCCAKPLALKLKAIERLLAAVPSDRMALISFIGIPRRRFVSLAAVTMLMLDEVEGARGLEGPRSVTNAYAMRHFLEAKGAAILLERVQRGDSSLDQTLDAVRMLGCMFNRNPLTGLACSITISREDGSEVLELLCRMTRHEDVRIMQQAAAMLEALVMFEVKARREEQEESGPESSRPQLGPVTSFVLATADVQRMAKAAGADREIVGGIGHASACLQFFHELCDEPAIYRAIMADRVVGSLLVSAYARALYLCEEEPQVVGLSFLARTIEMDPDFIPGIFTDTMMSWPDIAPEPPADWNQHTSCQNYSPCARDSFANVVLHMLDPDVIKRRSKPAPENFLRAPTNNWANATAIMQAILQHCPCVAKHFRAELDYMNELIVAHHSSPDMRKQLQYAKALVARPRSGGGAPARRR